MEERIRRELSLSNLSVSVVEGSSLQQGSMRTMLDSMLRRSAARGAVSVTVSQDEGVLAHTLFYNRETKSPEYHLHFLVPTPKDDTVEVAAIKTREAVFAALYESPPLFGPSETSDASRPTPGASNGASPGKNSSEPLAARKSVRLTGVFGGAWSPGGVGIMGIIGGDLQIRLPGRFALGAEGWGSFPRREIKASVGAASVRLVSGRVSGAFRFRRLGPLQPAVGLRLGILYLKSEGTSDTHPVASISNVLFYGSMYAEAAVEIAKRLVLPFALDIGAFAPGVDILFAKEPKAALNIFMIEARIGIGVLL